MLLRKGKDSKDNIGGLSDTGRTDLDVDINEETKANQERSENESCHDNNIVLQRHETVDFGTAGGTWASFIFNPLTPVTLSLYLQLFFNCALVLSFLYMLWSFFQAIQHDIYEKTSFQMLKLQQKIKNCQTQYISNFCDDSVPALQQKCSEWASCMLKNPATVGKLKLSAELLAEILDSFIQPISWKTVLFIFASVFGCIFLNNYIFYSFRQANGSISNTL